MWSTILFLESGSINTFEGRESYCGVQSELAPIARTTLDLESLDMCYPTLLGLSSRLVLEWHYYHLVFMVSFNPHDGVEE